MKRCIAFMIKQSRTLLACFLFISITHPSVHAQKQQSFEDFFYEIGYTSTSEAIVTCNKLFQKNIILPTRLPSIAFTHQFGRCNNLEGSLNDELELEYINQHEGKRHYILRVRPSKYRIEVEQLHQARKIYTLQDQTKAVLLQLKEIETLVFEKNGWQYMLSLNKEGIHTSPAEELIQIANTVK